VLVPTAKKHHEPFKDLVVPKGLFKEVLWTFGGTALVAIDRVVMPGILYDFILRSPAFTICDRLFQVQEPGVPDIPVFSAEPANDSEDLIFHEVSRDCRRCNIEERRIRATADRHGVFKNA
jgi:hypothetical protein